MTSSNGNSVSITQLIGRNARRLRLDAGVTLEKVAAAARSFGLPWNTGRVGSLESGRWSPTIDVLYATAAALGKAIGRPVRIAELLGTDSSATEASVVINDRLTIPATAVLGDVVPVAAGLSSKGLLTPQAEPVPPEQFVRNTFMEADERMCKSLGVDYDTGAKAMTALWKRPFTAERDSRAKPGDNAQAKGIIARRLKADLIAKLTEDR
jgi:transcriptional regulator with XRE-family HTH domain